MSDFEDKYRQGVKKETEIFIHLLNSEDAKLVFGRNKKSELDEYVRLASIAAVLGFRMIFMRICFNGRRRIKTFIERFECLNGNFDLLNGWVEEFIEKIEREEFRNLTREYWEEVKSKIDKEHFDKTKLFSFDT